MFNIKKFNIFEIEKEMKTENKTENQKNEERDRAFTFKITKKRSPWSIEEDQAITELVNKNGTCNWTLIANEMWSTYGFKNRSGKQCRERWHNHLDPNINKDYWSEKEENILFMKHIEYGNKWSDIAKYLPGRTDNSIKNHFYSKLRKFIRKILKQLNKENLLKVNSVDINKYNSDYVYKIIKKNKMPYNNLNKDTILNLIVNHDRNLKNGKIDSHFLRNKTNRRKMNKNFKVADEIVKVGENLYEEKVIKRRTKNYAEFDTINSANSRRISKRERCKLTNSNEVSKRNEDVKMKVATIYRRESGIKYSNDENKIQLCIFNLNIFYFLARSKRRLKKTHLREDFVYEDEKSLSKKRINYSAGLHGTLTRNETNQNKLENYLKKISRTITEEVREHESSDESEEDLTESDNAADYSENSYNYNEERKKGIENIYFTQQGFSDPVPLSSTNSHRENFIFEEKHHRTLQIDSLGYVDHIPMISPINTTTRIYPLSTKNHFNIDMISEDNQSQMKNKSYFQKSKINFNLGPNAFNSETQQLLHFPSNKEITLHNKILINESNIVSMEAISTPNFKDSKKEYSEKDNEFNFHEESISFIDKRRNNIIRPSIDLNLINDNDISKMFSESVVNSVKNLNNVNAQINLEDCDDFSKEEVKDILNTNLQDREKEKENILENEFRINENNSNSANTIVNLNSKHKPIVSPHNVRAFLNISPKSAFMKIN